MGECSHQLEPATCLDNHVHILNWSSVLVKYCGGIWELVLADDVELIQRNLEEWINQNYFKVTSSLWSMKGSYVFLTLAWNHFLGHLTLLVSEH